MAVNRKRIFKLPDIDDLSKEQDRAIELSVDGAHLITGGPGTGKSIVALLRARSLEQKKIPYLFLVYNHMLNRSNQQLFIDGGFLNSQTWDGWVRSYWRKHWNSGIPTKNKVRNYEPIDWDTVIRVISSYTDEQLLKIFHQRPHLIIDEGQDLPPQMYEFLDRVGFRDVYVAADENQQIEENNSKIQDIADELDIDDDEVIHLSSNYRNNLPIAQLSHHFFSDRGASKKTVLPDRPSSVLPLLVEYGEDKRWGFNEIIGRILKMAEREPSKLIGVITPNNYVRVKYVTELNKNDVQLDHGKPPITTYSSSGTENNMDFGSGGIMVVNAQSCKGLEFDIVFLADVDELFPQDVTALKPLFYVMVTRAKERLIILRTGNKSKVIDELLPNDEEILERKS